MLYQGQNRIWECQRKIDLSGERKKGSFCVFFRFAEEMSRPPFAYEAMGIYHSLNRGNLRTTIFKKEVPTTLLECSGMSINSNSKAFLFKVTNISSLFVVTSKETQCEPVWLRRRNNVVGVHCGDGFKDRSLYRSSCLHGRLRDSQIGRNV